MYSFTQRLGRVAPVAASAAVPLLLTARQERKLVHGRPTQCAGISGPRGSSKTSKYEPKHLIPRIDAVYKSWGRGGFDEKYEIEKAIGHGSFGTVYKARIKGTDRYRAVKKIDKSQIDMDEMRNEINSLLNVDHPHIIKLIRYYDEASHLYLIFELCTGPDLFDAVVESISSEQGSMSEGDVAVALRHMLKALKCCHGQFMGHYDIKPENFMYRSPERTNLKMIDLGSSSPFNKEANRVKGTYDYMAPEIYRGIYGPEADVWSVGIVLFVMLTGTPFFKTKDPDEMERLVHDRQFVMGRVKWASEQGISSSAHSLLRQMLLTDRHMRITVTEAIQHPFVAGSYRQDSHNYKEIHESKLIQEAMTVLDGFQDNVRDLFGQPMLTRATLMLTAHLVAHNQEAMFSHRLAFRLLDKAGHTQEAARRAGVGELSVDALEQALLGLNISIPEDMDDLFKLVDTDGDGYISFMDFLSATLPQSIRDDDANWHAAFIFFDRNADGFIDANDLIKATGYKTEKEIKTCHDAMREVCPSDSPQRISFPQFLHLVRKGSIPPPAEDEKDLSLTQPAIAKASSTPWTKIIIAGVISVLAAVLLCSPKTSTCEDSHESTSARECHHQVSYATSRRLCSPKTSTCKDVSKSGIRISKGHTVRCSTV